MNIAFNKDLIIDNSEGKFSEILQFAWNHPQKESLQKCLSHLELMCGNRSNVTVVRLYSDFAPMSLGFTMVDTLHDTNGMSGGLIYHGVIKGVRTDPLVCSLTQMNGWQLHT